VAGTAELFEQEPQQFRIVINDQQPMVCSAHGPEEMATT
jgi:hypothetical protein